MKNQIAFYYSLHPKEIAHLNDKYFFEYLGNNYALEPFGRPVSEADSLYKVNRQMISRNLLVHEIILNNEKNVITYINNIPYVLMEIYVNKNARITLADVCHINNNSINIECDSVIARYDWVFLWEAKNDYFEAQINEIGKKYPNLCNYVNYYIGLAENAISYVRFAMQLESQIQTSICHKRIDCSGTLYSLYNPLNYVCDYKVRDICEYVKNAFFCNKDAFDIVCTYFKNNYLSYKEALLFYGRLLYPSYFFDLYDDIVNKDLKENKIEDVVNKSDAYEIFLVNVYMYLSKIYNKYIPAIDWIIKKAI